MINMPGVLTVRIVIGRYGEFRVGRLITELGEFAVKNALLDQYNEGSYEGVFGVSRIYLSQYSVKKRLILDVRADIKTIALSNINPLTQYDDSLEQDPIEESIGNPPTSRIAPPKSESVIAADAPTQELDVFDSNTEADDNPAILTDTETTNDDDKQLFGLLWPLKNQLKLDAAVDRSIFRQQRDRLKALGYHFKPIGQLWTKP